MPKNYLKEGKYGPYNIHNISYNAASVIVDALSMIGDQANENAINDLQFKLGQPGISKADKGVCDSYRYIRLCCRRYCPKVSAKDLEYYEVN